MGIGSYLTGKIATKLTMDQMRRDHAEWAKTVTPGSVWYSKQPTTNWAANMGGHKPAHDKYVFVKPAGWPHSCGWITSGGYSSWEIWHNLNGTGLTQERMPTCADYDAAAEKLWATQATHMQQQVAQAAGWDDSFAKAVERQLAGVR